MNRVSWVQFGLFLAGLLAFVGAAFAGITAADYEYAHETTTSEITEIEDEIGSYGTTDLEEYTDEERAIIRDVVAGESIVVDDDSAVATRFGGTMVVDDGEEYHVIDRSTVVDWSSRGGIGAIALAVGGVILIADAFRRQYF